MRYFIVFWIIFAVGKYLFPEMPDLDRVALNGFTITLLALGDIRKSIKERE